MAKDKGGTAALVLLGLGAGGIALWAASSKKKPTLEEYKKDIKRLEDKLEPVKRTTGKKQVTVTTTTPTGDTKRVRVTQTSLAQQIAGYIRKYSKTFGIPENLLYAIIKIESNFNPNAVNRSPRAARRGNAWGLGQMTLQTAKDIIKRYPKTSKKFFPAWNGTGKGLLDPELNVAMTAFHLERLQNRFKNAKYRVLVTGLAHQQGAGNMIRILRRAPNRDITRASLPPNGKRYFAKLKSLLPRQLVS